MKKLFTILTIAAAVILAVACNKDGSKIKMNFATSLYDLEELGSVEVVLKLSEPAPSSVEIPVRFSGSAVKDTDYSVSSDKFTFNAGTSSSSITVTDLGMEKKGTITFNISADGDYELGDKFITTVAFPGIESIITNFDPVKADLIESLTVTLTLTGITSGNGFRAASDMKIPLQLTGAGADGVKLESEYITVPKGQNSGSVKLTLNEAFVETLTEKVEAILEVDRSKAPRFNAGDNGKVTISIRKPIEKSELVGTWKFAEIFDLEELELFFEEMEDDPTLLPVNNDGFTLTFTQDEETGEIKLVPGTTGDFANFYREAVVTKTAPKNTSTEAEILGDYTTLEVNMFEGEALGDGPFTYTYYALSNANRAFSADKETIGDSVIAVRFNKDGDLIIQFRDYDQPPFGENWWEDDKFDADMFAFCARYTKEN